ncbi:hypothetical protein ACUARH_001809 [Pseudomonas aeruginosa]|uniref:hypothetical protein n=1 Tax=Pseudomonas aeruginosa TaxID=287 RepID=UPI001069B4ED|nr:hypothetical protein [Pseudomonas aeruginosa]MDV6873278.1 hypothetical protein [Pseudomonas aeruginosa]MDV6937942.1 hypothetical protein [Pseudomonas aeruginosa]MDV6959055.1 hypothetical protein [Pseudomonas aeruginosa]
MATKKFTPEVQEVFLQVLEDTASPKQAAQVCGISRRLAFEYKQKDLEFRRRWEQSIQIAMDALLEEAYRRAVVGVDEPVIYQGQVSMTRDALTGEERALTVKKHSDRLLEVMLKFHYGDEMAERLRVKVEDTGLSADALLRMPSDERAQLVALLSKYNTAQDQDDE